MLDIASIASITAPMKKADATAMSSKQKSTLDQIDLSAVPDKYYKRFREMLYGYKDILNDDAEDIGHCKLMQQKIELKDPTQIACTPPYRVPPALQPVIDQFVDKLLTARVIRKSNSPFSSPLMLVRKANATPEMPIMEQYRVVNDFRKLNANTIKDSYPMQNIYQLIDDVAGASIASVLDLRSAFFILSLEEKSRKFTNFPVQGKGLFEYCRSPQGLINSSSSFQRLLDQIMSDIPKVRVYVDDIVVFSYSFEEHLTTLSKVLDKLRDCLLYTSPSPRDLSTSRMPSSA